MGRSEEEAHASVRFSLSRYTEEDEIEKTLSALSAVLEEKDRVRLISCK
jgi:cysteine sulfinate desulfinase/cysteine desulfurase-like protein